jgi:hypothetical protein
VSYQDVRHWYEDRDDDPEPVGRHDHEPPYAVYVVWFDEAKVRDYYSGETSFETVQCKRWFPASSWAWKHVLAWKAAMEKKYGHASIEEDF